MDMRNLINLVEGVETSEQHPTIFYHGTNPLAAAMILKDGYIEATEPVDDDGMGAVVCVTSDEDIGVAFAVEFARFNSSYDVGFVFQLNAHAVVDAIETVPYEAETASMDEHEYRVMGDIPLKQYMTGISIAGDVRLLRDDEYIAKMYKNGMKNPNFAIRFSTLKSFVAALRTLREKAISGL